MSADLTIDLTLQVNVDYDYSAGSRDHFNSRQQQWYPGDAPDVRVNKVEVQIADTWVDVTSQLTTREIDSIKDQLLGELEHA